MGTSGISASVNNTKCKTTIIIYFSIISVQVIWATCFSMLIHIMGKLRWLCSMCLVFSWEQQVIPRLCFARGDGRNARVASKCILDIYEKVGKARRYFTSSVQMWHIAFGPFHFAKTSGADPPCCRGLRNAAPRWAAVFQQEVCTVERKRKSLELN